MHAVNARSAKVDCPNSWSKPIVFLRSMYRGIVLSLLLSFASARLAKGADAAALWSGKVQPLFDVQCVKCHGLLKQKSGLELDTVDGVLRGGDEGAVVLPGKP